MGRAPRPVAGWSLGFALGVLVSPGCGARSGLDIGGGGSADAGAPAASDAGATDAAGCVPGCAGRLCGPDPVCGLSCGSCAGDEVCDPSGACRPLRWIAVESPTDGWLQDVWGSGRDDVWTVGGAWSAGEGPPRVVLHFDGVAWRPVSSPGTEPLHALWGFGPRNVWAAGDSGTLLHWRGEAWETVEPGTAASLYCLWGDVPRDVWAGGYGTDGALLRYDGTSWRDAAAPMPHTIRRALFGTSRRDVWLVVNPSGGTTSSFLHFDGSAWSTGLTVPGGVWGLWGSTPGDLWAVGDAGAILHFDGEWSFVEDPSPGRPSNYDVWGSGPNDVWTTGWGLIRHYDGRRWTDAESPATEGLFGVWGSGPHDVWAVGKHGVILHYGPVGG